MHGGSSARFPTKPTEKLKIEKMYAIKQIKICAEYRDMLPRPRLDLSGAPGLRPIGLSPGSWQTSLGLGSMSRYSAQILICIIRSRLVHPKDKVSKDERAGVVYQIQCSDCDAAYVGETERSLHIHLTAQPQLLDPPVGHHLNHWNLPGANELTNADTYSLRKRSLFSTRWLIGSAGG